MKNENSKSLTIGVIAVVLLMAWQMRVRPAGSVKLPEVAESAQKTQREPSSASSNTEPATVSKTASDKEALLKSIRETQACYASEKCDFPQTDPKSYEIAVGQALKALLVEYRTLYGADPINSGDTQALALEYVQSPDEFLQEEALSIFAMLPISSENLEAMTKGLVDTTDPLLVDQAMNEMKRYMGTSDEPQVHDYLRELLGRGGVFSSEAAAKKILSFINSQSFTGYDGLARSLPANSTVGQNLRTALDEYLRLQSGG